MNKFRNLFCRTNFLTGYGDYIPVSDYKIFNNGHRSDIVYLRSRRDLLPIFRYRRSAGGGSSPHANAQASASATSGSGIGEIITFPNIFLLKLGYHRLYYEHKHSSFNLYLS